MAKTLRYTIRLTPKLKEILEARARSDGFLNLGSYLRNIVMKEAQIRDKIMEMYEMIKHEYQDKK